MFPIRYSIRQLLIAILAVSVVLALAIPILRRASSVTPEELEIVARVNSSAWLRLEPHEYGLPEGIAFVLSIQVNCPNPDEELKTFGPLLKGLRRVDVYAAGTQLTDQGLAELHSVQSLCEVLVDDTRVSEDAIRKLQQHVPNCKLVHNTRDWYP